MIWCKTCSLVFFLFIGGSYADGQQLLPDSLNQKIDQLETSDQYKYLDSLSKLSLRTAPELYLKLARAGMKIAESVSDDSIYNRFKTNLGTYYTYQDKLDSARMIFEEVLSQASASDLHLKGNLLSEIGITYYYESNDAKALSYFSKALHEFEQLQDTARIAGLTNNIGALYRYLGDYEAAGKYLKKAVLYKLMIGDSTKLGSTYHNLGINFQDRNKPDSAFLYFKIAQQIREKYNDQRGLAKTYVSLSIIHRDDGNVDSAKLFIKKAIKIDRRLNDQVALQSDQFSLADIYFSEGAFQNTIEILKVVVDKTTDVRVKQSSLELIAQAYDQIGTYQQASEARKRLLNLSDSIYLAEKEASLRELQVKFDTEQKETEIKQLTADNKIKQLQAEQDAQTRLILIIVLLALFVIAILFYARFRSKAKTNALLDIKNQELAKLNQTKDRLFSIISHDLKSPLSSFHLITKSLADNLDALDKSQLKEYLLALQESSGNIKEMMDNLLKWALAQTDQLAGKMEPVQVNNIIEEVINQMSVVSSSKSITIGKRTHDGLLLEGDASFVEIVLRNLISNSLKFTPSGKSIQVETEAQESKAILRVIDEGVGMDQSDIERLLSGEIIGQEIQNSTEKGTGLGVNLIQELVKKMNGSLSVTTEKGKGTTFELSFNRAA